MSSNTVNQQPNVIPNDWICPITMELMKDPCIGPDGHTYERVAIEQWLIRNTISPMTRQPMNNTNIIPNIALRHTIEDFLQRTNGIYSTQQNIPSNNNINIIDEDYSHEVNYANINGEDYFNVSIIPPKNIPVSATRKPTVFICILDVSGSMDTKVELNNGNSVESHGFSRLDLVKHSMNTITNILSENDYLAIVSFSDTAKVTLNITPMSTYGKSIARDTINTMRTEGSTNIWDGLRVGIELTKDIICKDKNVATLLLTDGEPNINPPRGIVDTLKNYVKDISSNFTINTFGFGYNLDSNLLNSISEIGNGTYAFIPDCSLVGSVFVNYLSTILATFAYNTKVFINNKMINYGPTQYGQQINILIKKSDIVNPEITVNYDIGIGSSKEIKFNFDGFNTNNNIVVRQYAINYMINKIWVSINNANHNIQESYQNICSLRTFIENLNTNSNLDDILMDIYDTNPNNGQIAKSFERVDWFNKWGKHYLLSFIRAHTLFMCNNFKDHSVQNYGGELFKEIQKFAEDEFCKIPPPTPSAHNNHYGGSVNTPANMSSYMNASGGCFAGVGSVEMANGSFKLVKNIRKGDVVKSRDGPATVQCVVKTKVEEGKLDMVSLNDDLFITPFHPVCIDGVWDFPLNFKNTFTFETNFVYDFILDKGHTVLINSIECVTLGHSFTQDKVKHHYFGSNKVIQDLSEHPDYTSGLVIISNSNFVRNKDGLVDKILF